MDWKKIRFSPEIEVYFNHDQYWRIKDKKAFGIKNWVQGYDNSIVSDEEQEERGEEWPGAEFRPNIDNKLFYNKKSLYEIEQLFQAIKENGGEINENCGGHIHIDVSNLSIEQIKKIIKKFYVYQEEILTKYKPWKTRKKFCEPVTSRVLLLKTKTDFLKNYNDGDFLSEVFLKKYWALNLGTYKTYRTLEFRFFNGTLDFKQFKRRIKWLLKFVSGVE